jgi:hypothetical protein
MPVTVNTDLPLHDDRSRDWDGDAARAALASRCSSEDGVSADCMGPGFIWRDGDAEASTIGAYKLPVADVFDGDVHLVLSGVQAAANAISPEREPGGPRALEASEAELGEMRSAVEAILARFAREFDDDSIRAPWEEDASETAAATPPVAASGCCGGCGCKSGQTNDDAADERSEPKQEEAAMSSTSAQPIQVRSRSNVLRASATGGEWRPPTDHFANPRLTEPTKLTVTADGRVYGHLATWDQPHIGYDGKLVYPPRNRDGSYGYFRQSQVVTADGSVVPVGLITMNTGHADESLSADAAAAHYDNTGTMMAACNVGEDSLGIWLAGSMLPDVSPELRNRFSLARVSGDWRQPKPGSPLELIAALSVPNPGFPVRQNPELLAADRLTLAASGLVRAEAGEIRTFICAGAAVVDEAQQAALADAVRSVIGPDFITQIKDAVVEAIKAEAPAAPEPPAAAEPAPAEAEAKAEEAPAAPVEEVPAEAAAQETTAPAAEEAAAPAETAPAATDAGGAAAVPATDPVDAPASPAPAPTAPVEAAQVAASALAAQLLKHRSVTARKRLMAAAGRGKKA